MKHAAYIWALLIGLLSVGLSGCHRNVVRAAQPPAPTRATVSPMPQPVPAERSPETRSEPAPELPATPAPEAIAPAPAPPRKPAAPEAATPRAKAQPPQISPELTPQAQAEAMRHTTDDIRTAERNLQRASGKRLDASQSDLVAKVRDFLAQAHEAIQANDWIRARNLSLKAQVLSTELMKSF